MPPPPSRTMPPPPLKLMSSTPFSEAGHSISNPTKSTSDPVPGEYKCKGRGADLRRQVPWAISFRDEEARPFLDRNFNRQKERRSESLAKKRSRLSAASKPSVAA
ncbi:hypothetical protein IFM89_005278 [Coptis chinensis]|uniref:Uncharacterized protein n=1 Tax=Coptis chinensis TaxID=261450 RepID=A0A835MHC5_9MAGN|nr:hypothetical protein IFM89_005278 [Coptis chinensis]